MILTVASSSWLRDELTMGQKWNGPDKALIFCWETGRRRALAEPSLAAKARAGELPELPWKGGAIDPIPKSRCREGNFYYLATWQGLRGDWLVIDTEQAIKLTCSRTGLIVTFRATPLKI